MNDFPQVDYILQPQFRLMTDAELEERAKKNAACMCLVVGCQETRYTCGDQTWIVCADHREKFMRASGTWDDLGFDEMVTEEFS